MPHLRSIRIAVLVVLIMLCALPSLTNHRAARAATCVTNPVVMNNSDSGAGSLRQAIMDACDGSTVTFANTVVGPITLASELAIDKNLTIQGPGAAALTISGNNAVRVFNIGSVNPSINVTLSGLTITNGKATAIMPPNLDLGLYGGGIFSNSSGSVTINNSTIAGNAAGPSFNLLAQGGGIFNAGSGVMNLTNSTVSANTAFEGGGIWSFGTLVVTNSLISVNNGSEGAGIFNEGNGAVTISNSTISGNTAGGLGGGGIFNGAGCTMAVTNTTISNNASTDGGGIINVSTMTVTNSTISGNAATNVGGGIFTEFALTVTNSTISNNHSRFGGGIDNIFTANLRNSIVGLNGATLGSDVDGVFISQGHNLIGNADRSTGFTNGVNGDQVGSSASPLDPKLGPLQNNGGPTLTMALLPGSPAIDAGDDSVLGAPLFLTTDQRGPGFARKVGTHVDIGAFEVQFDTCLKDTSTGNLFQFSSATASYKFTRCSDGFMVSGTGVVRTVNGILTLTDSKPDRRVSAGFYTSQRTGSATIYIMIAPGVWQSFRINSTNPSAVCGC